MLEFPLITGNKAVTTSYDSVTWVPIISKVPIKKQDLIGKV